jgi:hypothetical protein
MHLMLIHGLDFNVQWSKFIVGASFFIPCLDTEEALIQIKRTTRRLGFRIKSLAVIEHGVYGLRIWRIK